MNVAEEEDGMNAPVPKGVVDGESEAIDVPLRPEEKKRLNWENGLYLAPLTTVGNLVRPAVTVSRPPNSRSALPTPVCRLRGDYHCFRDGLGAAPRHGSG